MLDSLRALYVEQLRDLYSAERQVLDALPDLAERARNPVLKGVFQEHEQATRLHLSRLDEVFGELGEDPSGHHCRGMEGLLREGREMLREGADPAVRDAGLIAAAQRIEHYEIAGYGCVRTYAVRLGLNAQADTLQRTLDEEGDVDHRLSALAEQVINPAAEGSGG